MPQVLPWAAVAHAVPPLAYSQGSAPICSHHSLRPPPHLLGAITTLVSIWSSLGKLRVALLQAHQWGQWTPHLLRCPATMFRSLLGAAVFSYYVFSLYQGQKM